MSKHYYRSGPAIRDNNQPVSFVDVRRRFDFSSIRIGRWVSAEEQHRAAGYFYDALCDLMTILSVPETVISLRGTLSLEYGIGGQKGVAAHYIPAQRVFALAKNAGPGSMLMNGSMPLITILRHMPFSICQPDNLHPRLG